jgi:uncharacterized membrane protein YkoI
MRLDRGLAVLALLVAAALVATTPLPVGARDQDELHRDEVRQAVEAGDIRSLTDILKAIRDKLPGEVTGVEIEHEKDRWRYELRVVDGQGRLFEVYVDARSAEIERIKEK